MASTPRQDGQSGGKKHARTSKKAAEPRESSAADTGESRVCNVGFCPIALTLSAVEPIKPDVVEHLLIAGRELLLAARSVLDARADAVEHDATSRLEKIEIG
jgi:hypothetical protein